MYNLQLTAEQLEIRDMLRDFVEREFKPVVLKADRIDVRDRTLPIDLLDQASQLGMRTLALSEDRGGGGAAARTTGNGAGELGAGDADIAAQLSATSPLGPNQLDRGICDAPRDR